MLKRKLAGALLITAVLVMSLVQPAVALDLEGERARSKVDDTVNRVEQKTRDLEDEAERNVSRSTFVKETSEDFRERLKAQRDRIMERRTQMKDKMRNLKEVRKQKLEGNRLKTCEEREPRINKLIDRSVQVSKQRLTFLQRIEAGVKKFYETNGLASDDYDVTMQKLDDKEASAVAAVDAADAENFDCSAVDGEKPGHILKTMRQDRREALREYRVALKELIVLVRQAIRAQVAAEGGDS